MPPGSYHRREMDIDPTIELRDSAAELAPTSGSLSRDGPIRLPAGMGIASGDRNQGNGSSRGARTIPTSPPILIDSNTNEVSMAVIDAAFGPDSDLYNDILGISFTSNMEQIQDAYFDRRNQLLRLLAEIDNAIIEAEASENANTSKTSNNGSSKSKNAGEETKKKKDTAKLVREHFRYETERKMDALVSAIRILRDPELRVQYDEIIRKERFSRKQQLQLQPPKLRLGMLDSKKGYPLASERQSQQLSHQRQKMQERVQKQALQKQAVNTNVLQRPVEQRSHHPTQPHQQVQPHQQPQEPELNHGQQPLHSSVIPAPLKTAQSPSPTPMVRMSPPKSVVDDNILKSQQQQATISNDYHDSGTMNSSLGNTTNVGVTIHRQSSGIKLSNSTGSSIHGGIVVGGGSSSTDVADNLQQQRTRLLQQQQRARFLQQQQHRQAHYEQSVLQQQALDQKLLQVSNKASSNVRVSAAAVNRPMTPPFQQPPNVSLHHSRSNHPVNIRSNSPPLSPSPQLMEHQQLYKSLLLQQQLNHASIPHQMLPQTPVPASPSTTYQPHSSSGIRGVSPSPIPPRFRNFESNNSSIRRNISPTIGPGNSTISPTTKFTATAALPSPSLLGQHSYGNNHHQHILPLKSEANENVILNKKKNKAEAIVRDSNYLGALMRANPDFPSPPRLPIFLDANGGRLGYHNNNNDDDDNNTYGNNNYNDGSIVSVLTNPTALSLASLAYSNDVNTTQNANSTHHSPANCQIDSNSYMGTTSLEDTVVSNSTMALNSYSPGPFLKAEDNYSEVEHNNSEVQNTALRTIGLHNPSNVESLNVNQQLQKHDVSSRNGFYKDPVPVNNNPTSILKKNGNHLPSKDSNQTQSKLKSPSDERKRKGRRVRMTNESRKDSDPKQRKKRSTRDDDDGSLTSTPSEQRADGSEKGLMDDDSYTSTLYTTTYEENQSAAGGMTTDGEEYDDDDISLSESFVRRHEAVMNAKENAGFFDRIRLEILGVIDDTSRSFQQVFNAFTLQPNEIDAVAGRIDKAKRQISQSFQQGGVVTTTSTTSSSIAQTGTAATTSSNTSSVPTVQRRGAPTSMKASTTPITRSEGVKTNKEIQRQDHQTPKLSSSVKDSGGDSSKGKKSKSESRRNTSKTRRSGLV